MQKLQRVPQIARTKCQNLNLRARLPNFCYRHASRYNVLNVQMLSESLRRQIFRQETSEKLDGDLFKKVEHHLKEHHLFDKITPELPNISFELPKLFGKNIDDHFRKIAAEQCHRYKKVADKFCSHGLPPVPSQWCIREGWTKYCPKSGTAVAVSSPQEQVLVFDVEVLVPEGNYPTLATAVSPTAWYSWCSHRLFDDNRPLCGDVSLKDLIPMETRENSFCLIIGHNVGFDRSFLRDLYKIENSPCKFLDTMSLHIATAGLTSSQRTLYIAKTKGNLGGKEVREMFENAQEHNWQWLKNSSLNNLVDVHRLYCGGKKASISKDTRNVFVKGTMQDVRQQLQKLMKYCASDVIATHDVLQQVWPKFKERFPHPVTFAGMLEMGSSYLPVNNNWFRYLNAANRCYQDYQEQLRKVLMSLADQALNLLPNERYCQDMWLWDLDWTFRKVRKDAVSEAALEMCSESSRSGYLQVPRWYADLCPTPAELGQGHLPGPLKISPQRRVSPKLLRLTWHGNPLHYDSEHGWGFLVVNKQELYPEDEISKELLRQEKNVQDAQKEIRFPLQQFLKLKQPSTPSSTNDIMHTEEKALEEVIHQKHAELERATDENDRIRLMREIKAAEKKYKTQQQQSHRKPLSAEVDGHDIGIHGVKFHPLPHKDGPSNRVGNPLSKDFLPKIDEGVLASAAGEGINETLRLNSTCSYWKNSQERIKEQLVVQLQAPYLPRTVTRSSDYSSDSYLGAILPRIITAGTVTRRAVEKTWLTASNAYEDRIGSELKAMVQSPPGYCFVGADVDSQELWIASVLGDSYFAGIHGCTAFGWMTLQGNKQDGTDLHSRTASLVGMSRDTAKIFNYGRIYGAGQRFAQRLLMQFNSEMSEDEAKLKTSTLYQATKGKQIRRFQGERQDRWHGGSESAMFNKLEQVATSHRPRTPVLDARISAALEPAHVSSDFLTSRVNWVVQSSAVDYLHLMLVCMRWLFDSYNINGRFAISIHDEVRYLVTEEDKYRAALALQITNLLTRSVFAYKLGMNDLPQSVAFFSAVDLDYCLRKEVHMDCKTPSNPLGLEEGYGMLPGKALTITDILDLTNGRLDQQDECEATLETLDIVL